MYKVYSHTPTHQTRSFYARTRQLVVVVAPEVATDL